MKLDDAALDELSRWARMLSLAAGDVLVHEGDEASEVFYLRTGRLSATTRGRSGEILLGHVQPGELIGEIAVVTGQRRMATLRAAEPSVVFAIPRAVFEEWINGQRCVADAVAAAARERIDRAQVAKMIEALVGIGDPTCVQDILDAVEWRRVSAGEVVFQQGDISDAAYFIVSGRLIATRRESDATIQRLHEMGNGEVVGELGLIDDAPRAATVRAIRDSSLARFSSERFRTLIERHPGLALHVARGVLHRSTRGGHVRRRSRLPSSRQLMRADLLPRFSRRSSATARRSTSQANVSTRCSANRESLRRASRTLACRVCRSSCTRPTSRTTTSCTRPIES